jgi:hypothetical protein
MLSPKIDRPHPPVMPLPSPAEAATTPSSALPISRCPAQEARAALTLPEDVEPHRPEHHTLPAVDAEEQLEPSPAEARPSPPS